MTVADRIQSDIDAAWAAAQGSSHRYHLGASVVGGRCAREVWYKFRWFHAVHHSGRLLRLFNRGHREEAHAIENLRKIGAVVQDTDPATGRQVKFSYLGGLFGGERDGAISNLEAYGLHGWGLVEFKTHGEKSFNNLKSKGLLTAKPEHYIQMQMYMGWSGFAWGLYYAVNKNTDEVYIAVVPFRVELYEQYTDRARSIIESNTPPPRVSEDPSWYICRFCDFKRVCHEQATPDKNCRTCTRCELRMASDSHAWHCGHWRSDIPQEYTRKGCDQWHPIQT